MYAFTLVPLFFVYLETACFLVSFFVALPTTAPASNGSSGIGVLTPPFHADHIIMFPRPWAPAFTPHTGHTESLFTHTLASNEYCARVSPLITSASN